MSYKDDDIEFANRLLTRREELNDEEVTAWLKEKNHVELLDEIAAIRRVCRVTDDAYEALKTMIRPGVSASGEEYL